MNYLTMVGLVITALTQALNAQASETRTLQEFKDYVNGKMSGLSDEQLDKIAKAVDANGDSKVEASEFAARMDAIASVMGGPAGGGGGRPEGGRRPQPPAPPVSTMDYMDRKPSSVPSALPKGTKAAILLIAGDELASAWVPFANWKTKQGKPTKIITVREIARSYEASTIEEKIRLCVREHVEKDGTRWILLGGDTEPGGGLVPGGPRTYHREEPAGIPTDIIFISPTNWDADGDGRHGEWEEDREAITYPDGSVGLGRVPVRTAADIAAFTDKVVSYESKFPTGDFSKSMLYTSTEPNSTPKVLASWDRYISKSWPGRVERMRPSPKGDEALPTVENVARALDTKSASKIHIHGHGLLDRWVFSDGSFEANDVGALASSDIYPLITTVSCNTGEYDSKSDPSIVESMIRAPKRGSAAIVAPIRTGKMHFKNPATDFELMVSEGKLDGTTMTMTQYWLYGLRDGASTGEALMKAKSFLSADALESASLHLCICEINLLGDPTLDFRADSPRTPKLVVSSMTKAKGRLLRVETDAPGATVTLWRGRDVYKVKRADQAGIAVFRCDVSKPGKIEIGVHGASLNSQTWSFEVEEAQPKSESSRRSDASNSRTRGTAVRKSQLERDASLMAPRPLLAADGPLESADVYAAPALGDVDRDGRLDVLVGDFGTKHGPFPLGEISDEFGGMAGQVKTYLGTSSQEAKTFSAGKWATTVGGRKVQSPTW